MPIKKYKPTTPGRRGMSSLTFEEVTVRKPLKRLTRRSKVFAGRNHSGQKTIGDKGGGHKQRYRMVDFKRTDKLAIPAKVVTVEYDPNRNAFIMLCSYADGEKRYHLAPEGIKVGDQIVANERTKVKPGNRMMLKNIPIGYNIYNIELNRGRGGQLARGAGASAQLTSLENERAQIQLPSGEIRFVEKECYATIGTVSNADFQNINIGKAGRNRWKGCKPHVRGAAKNTREHPHGGGEGKAPIGLKHPKTPWGMPALGLKTRNRKKYSTKWIIRSRRGRTLIKQSEQ